MVEGKGFVERIGIVSRANVLRAIAVVSPDTDAEKVLAAVLASPFRRVAVVDGGCAAPARVNSEEMIRNFSCGLGGDYSVVGVTRGLAHEDGHQH